jgi:hypothetical protein
MTGTIRTLTLFVAAALFSLLTVGAGQAQDSSPTATMPATQPAIALDNGLQIVDRRSNETIEKPKLSIDVSKPVLTGQTGPAVEGFNKAVDSIIQDTVGTFKKDTLENEAIATLPPDIADLGSYLSVNYEVFNTPNGLISVRFNVGWYSAGAAHPNSYTISLNYDLAASKTLALADLFKPKARYLDALSAYCIKALEAADRLDFPEGAAPKEENFRSWNITQDGLLINFDDYQVTPHAVGPQHVVVPYATLTSLIRMDGPLAKFVK